MSATTTTTTTKLKDLLRHTINGSTRPQRTKSYPANQDLKLTNIFSKTPDLLTTMTTTTAVTKNRRLSSSMHRKIRGEETVILTSYALRTRSAKKHFRSSHSDDSDSSDLSSSEDFVFNSVSFKFNFRLSG